MPKRNGHPRQLPLLPEAPTLRAYLRESGVSQYDLAKAVGVNQSTISQLSRGGRRASGKLALRISKCTGVKVEGILAARRLAKTK